MKRIASAVSLLVPLFAGWTATAADKPTASREGVTLERLLSVPFPTSLVAAPAGGKVAWVFNDRGRRNVWVAEPPDYKGRALTDYDKDDGLDLTDLAWAPDGRTLCYVRGNADHAGETLNPRNVPQVSERTVWVRTIERGVWHALGAGHAPAVSPKGDRVVFLHKGQVWTSLIASGSARQFFHARGQVRQLRWSPDGSLLAFVSDRGDHSFVGVYRVSDQTISWLDPSVDRDSDPAWSPDGKQIAFRRTPASRELEYSFAPQPTAEPWSVRVATVADGKGHEVWKASPGTGSAFREIVAENQIFWGADDRLVFPWEADGWTHLYSIPVAGGKPTLLTPGKFEVESVTMSPDRTRLVVSSNQDDIDRRHLWTVPVRGGEPEALMQSLGIEWSPVVTSDGKGIAFLRSNARQPARPAIQIGTRVRNMTDDPADFPADKLVVPQAVTITAADGKKAPAQLFLPPGLKPGERCPAVLYTHGGSRRQMLLGWHMMDGYSNHYALHQYLALRGFVVLSLNYRSGIGYGLDFREAPGYGAGGASEFNDLLGAGRYLKNRPDVDPERVGLWGGSYGGYLTALGLARASNLFAAGVDIHGVYDWNVVIRNFEPTYDPLVRREQAKLAYDSSPIAFVKTWRSPVLVIHGDHDPQVPFSESVRLVEDLRKQKVDVEQLVFPDEAHGFLTHEAWLRGLQATADYLERRLRPKGGAAEKGRVPNGGGR
jgi:dipeptidyl aminopeptidase/acylaminoacyl peptidase